MTVTLRAYAKINLTLEVTGRRPDGYHEIISILQAISLCDTVTAEEASRLSLESPDLGCHPDENLVARAAWLLQAEHAPGRGASLRLEKRIPAAAGLGGGSSDAAAALVALNRLWELGLTRQELTRLAARLGSDVPFFLHGPTALASGRGDLLTELPALDSMWLLLVVPPVQIAAKTRTLYGSLTPADYSDGSASLKVAEGLLAGRGLDVHSLCNAFERPAFGRYPIIAQYRDELKACGAPFVCLSGSGPSLFTLVESRTQAQAVFGALQSKGIHGEIARLLGHEFRADGAWVPGDGLAERTARRP